MRTITPGPVSLVAIFTQDPISSGPGFEVMLRFPLGRAAAPPKR